MVLKYITNCLSHLSLLFLYCLVPQSHSHGVIKLNPKVLMISFDGFRHDYLEMAEKDGRNVSAFRKLWETGVRANYMQNVFTTRTFPNHFTLVTGQYEESHGMVDNNFYDPEFKAAFDSKNVTDNFDPRWYYMNNLTEPIWATNKRHGFDTGIFYWIGSVVPRNGFVSTKTFGYYNQYPPLSYRIDRVIDWLTSCEKTTLGLLYYHEPDATGHLVGPNGKEILDRVEELNTGLVYLMDRLEKVPHLKSVLNILLVSDHGMAEISTERAIAVDSLVSPDLYTTYHESEYPLWGIWPKKQGDTQTIFDNLKHPHAKAYLKENIPEEFHYKNNRRIAPILFVADEGWSLVHKAPNETTPRIGGTHGYNNSLPSMRPYFIANGPAFKVGLQVPMVHMVDIYPLICSLLSLNHPAHNNGSLERIAIILKKSYEEVEHGFLTSTFVTYVTIIALVALVAGYFSLAAVQQHRTLRYSSPWRGTPYRPKISQSRLANPDEEAELGLLGENDVKDDERL